MISPSALIFGIGFAIAAFAVLVVAAVWE